MKRILKIAMTLLVVPLVLMGCDTSDKDIDDIDDIVKVSLSESKDLYEMNTDFFVVYEDEDTIEMFETIFEDAVKQDGIVDIAAPDYDIEAELENGSKQQYYLWVGEADQSSTLMRVEDMNTIYLIPADDTNWLIDLLK